MGKLRLSMVSMYAPVGVAAPNENKKIRRGYMTGLRQGGPVASTPMTMARAALPTGTLMNGCDM